MTHEARALLRERIERDIFRHPRVRDADRTCRVPSRFEANAGSGRLWIRRVNSNCVVYIDQHTGASRAVTAAIVGTYEPDTGLMVRVESSPIGQRFPWLIPEAHALSLRSVRAGQSVSGIRDMTSFRVPLSPHRETPSFPVGVQLAQLGGLPIARINRQKMIEESLVIRIHRVGLNRLDLDHLLCSAGGVRKRQSRPDEIGTRQHLTADQLDTKNSPINSDARNTVGQRLPVRRGGEQPRHHTPRSTNSLPHRDPIPDFECPQVESSTPTDSQSIRARPNLDQIAHVPRPSPRRRGCCVWPALFVLLVGLRARADHASDNVIIVAEDAFGLTLGTETIGLYDQNQVRGFSPQIAGNARIDGLYFDQQAPLSNRTLEGSTIRVGISALGYPFPAPTGIVDYDLRHAGDKPALTAVADLGPFNSRGLDLDGQLPIAALNLRVPVGVSYRINAGLPDYTQQIVSVGVAPQWTPTQGLALRAFWDWQRISRDRVAPLFFMGTSSLPPQTPASYLGQDWATGKSFHENYGATAKAELGPRWSLRAGIFRSVNDSPIGYADLFANTQPSGTSDHQLIGYPDQRTSSTSGDVQLVGRFGEGVWRHEVVLSLRGRDVLARYDGADVQDIGTALIGLGVQVPRPNFTYGPLTRDDNQLWAAGVAYHGRWAQLGEFSAGIERVDYLKSVTLPGDATVRRTDEPWRFYGIIAINLLKGADLYAGYTQGVEDSGVAPSDAANRGEILPATLTWQVDAGLKYAVTPSVKLIAGVFDVHKPYFNLGAANYYVDLGSQNHRGYEFSIAGEIVPDLNVVAGLEVLNAQVAASPSASVPVGPLSVGQNKHLAQINLDYRFQWWHAVSVDATFYSYGRRPANLDNSVSLPSTQSVDVGARYRFAMFQAPATLRFLIQNVGNVYSWALTDSAGFSPAPRRSAQIYLTADF